MIFMAVFLVGVFCVALASLLILNELLFIQDWNGFFYGMRQLYFSETLYY